MALIYKILPRDEWEAFGRTGQFAGSPVDRRDGFIHFSYAHQLAETARRHFANRPDLVLLAVPRAQVAGALRDEVSRGGDLFPHLFAELALADILWMKPLVLDAAGFPVLPPLEENG